MKIQIYFLCVLTVLLFTNSCQEENTEPQMLPTSVEGVIINSSTNQPMTNAVVRVADGTLFAIPSNTLHNDTTDSNGYYYFEFMANSEWRYFLDVDPDENPGLDFIGQIEWGTDGYAPYHRYKEIEKGAHNVLNLNPATKASVHFTFIGDSGADSMSTVIEPEYLTEYFGYTSWHYPNDTNDVGHYYGAPSGKYFLHKHLWIGGIETAIVDTYWVDPLNVLQDTIHF